MRNTIAAEPIIASCAALLTAEEWIEIVFAKPITLVASPTATPSFKTHLCKQTFESPHETGPGNVDEPHPATGWSRNKQSKRILTAPHLHDFPQDCEHIRESASGRAGCAICFSAR